MFLSAPNLFLGLSQVRCSIWEGGDKGPMDYRVARNSRFGAGLLCLP